MVTWPEVRWDPETARWHVAGKPVHAGYYLQLRGHSEADWVTVRIESRYSGRILDAHLVTAGVSFCCLEICGFTAEATAYTRVELRWPPERY